MEGQGTIFPEKNILDYFRKENYAYIILAIIVVFGCVLRFFAATGAPQNSDEMVFVIRAINYLDLNHVSNYLQAPVWFSLIDIMYKILGVTLFSARFMSFMFGTLTIAVIFLLGDLVFGKKIGLVGAFLLAISPYHLQFTIAEMDEAMIFFILFAAYIFIKKLKEKGEFSYVVPVLLGISLLIKTITLFFLPAFGIFALIGLYLKERSGAATPYIATLFNTLKKNARRIAISTLIFLFFLTPLISYNYLLYKEKGITDTYVGQYFGVSSSREFYKFQIGYNSSYFIKGVFPVISVVLQNGYLKYEPIALVLGLIGAFLAIKFARNKFETVFLIALNALSCFLVLGTGNLTTHYVSFVPLLCLFSGFALVKSTEFIQFKFGKINRDKLLIGCLIAILIINSYMVLPKTLEKDDVGTLRDYTISSIEPDALVVADARIYRGQTVFMFNDRHYIESSLLGQALAVLNNTSQNRQIKTYFIECVLDDCGWGTIQTGDALYNATEAMIAEISKNGILEKEIPCGNAFYPRTPQHTCYRIYSTYIVTQPQIFDVVDSTHDFWMYSVGYTDKNTYDSYTPKSIFDKILNGLGYVALYSAILFALLSPVLLIWEILKRKKTS